MQNTPRPKKTVSIEQIARIAEGGNDVSRFFSNTGKMMRPTQRVNVDFEPPDIARVEQELPKKTKERAR